MDTLGTWGDQVLQSNISLSGIEVSGWHEHFVHGQCRWGNVFHRESVWVVLPFLPEHVPWTTNRHARLRSGWCASAALQWL